MNGLIDTHNFIWSDANPELLSPQVRDFIEDRNNRLFLSIASIWEMQIKMQNGKLALKHTLQDTVRRQEEENGLQILPIRMMHVYDLRNLPLHHRDPFDRIIIAQARVEYLTVLSADEIFEHYSVQLLR